MPRKTGQRRYHRPSASSSTAGNHLPPSPSSSRWDTPRRLPSKRVTRPVNVLKRCSSAPGLLHRIGTGVEGHNDEDSAMRGVARSFTFNHRALFMGHTYTDVLLSHSSSCFPEGYRKDAKVVVNVTVEGSPGPIRTMVRLGCSVGDTILAVVDRYGQEGRTPKLDRDSVTSYELHHSYFSLQSLEKSECIGGVGSRRFYLRTSSDNNSVSPGSNLPPPVIPPLFMVSTFIAHKLGGGCGYGQRQRKQLVHVTVGRCTGAVRVLMSPEDTVADLVAATVEAYMKEMRRPLLTETDPRRFRLHYSPFCLESIDPNENVMKLGSRNFFLCTNTKLLFDQIPLHSQLPI